MTQSVNCGYEKESGNWVNLRKLRLKFLSQICSLRYFVQYNETLCFSVFAAFFTEQRPFLTIYKVCRIIPLRNEYSH